MSVQPPPPQGAYTPPPASDTPPAYQSGPAPGIRYSGRLARFFAYLIDGFVIGIISGIPYFIGIMLLTVGAQNESGIFMLIGSLIMLLGALIAVAYAVHALWLLSTGRPELNMWYGPFGAQEELDAELDELHKRTDASNPAPDHTPDNARNHG